MYAIPKPLARATVGILAAASLPFVAACDDNSNSSGDASRTLSFDFTDPDAGDAEGWEAGFADYSAEQEDIMELASGYEPLPGQLSDQGHGLMIGATNRSDDVFMYWTGPVSGLAPETSYSVEFEVQFATDSPSDCAGIGGPPGEAVQVKAGMTLDQPDRELVDGDWRMTIDKGNQSAGGSDAVVMGHVGNESSGCLTGERVWELKTLESSTPLVLNTDTNGSAWLTMGTDSGFEGRTELYYTRIEAELTPR